MIVRSLIVLAAILLPTGIAMAGPPFLTDDPGVLGKGEVEIFPYFDLMTSPGPDTGNAGIDATVGIVPGMEAGIVVPLHTFESGRDEFTLGDVALTTKFTLIESGNSGPSVAFGPSLALPTARSGRARTGLNMPLWIGFERGSWSFYGGGGYRFDAASDGGGRPFGGIVTHHSASERLGLGAEVYIEGGNARSPLLVMAGLGFDWAFAPQASLVAAGHAVLANHQANGRIHFYMALVITP